MKRNLLEQALDATVAKLEPIERDCMACEKTFTTTIPTDICRECLEIGERIMWISKHAGYRNDCSACGRTGTYQTRKDAVDQAERHLTEKHTGTVDYVNIHNHAGKLTNVVIGK